MEVATPDVPAVQRWVVRTLVGSEANGAPRMIGARGPGAPIRVAEINYPTAVHA